MRSVGNHTKATRHHESAITQTTRSKVSHQDHNPLSPHHTRALAQEYSNQSAHVRMIKPRFDKPSRDKMHKHTHSHERYQEKESPGKSDHCNTRYRFTQQPNTQQERSWLRARSSVGLSSASAHNEPSDTRLCSDESAAAQPRLQQARVSSTHKNASAAATTFSYFSFTFCKNSSSHTTRPSAIAQRERVPVQRWRVNQS